MIVVVNGIESNSLSIRSVAGFIKQHVDSIIYKCHVTQLNAKTGEENKKGVALPRADCHRMQHKSPKTPASAKAPRTGAVKDNNTHREGLDHAKE